MKQYISLLGVAVLAIVMGCSKELTPSGPNGFGTIDRSTYAAIGNSITAGYQSGALYEEAQQYSMTNQIAQQLGTNIVQPIFPGNGTGSRIHLTSLNPVTLSTGAPSMIPPSNISHPAPYNNLGIPGSIMFDALDTNDVSAKSLARSNPFFRLVLRDQAAFGRTQVLQAVKLKPTVVTLWLGNNDILGYATSGGVSPSSIMPSTVFESQFHNTVVAILDSLPKVSLVCGNIPDVAAIPFFTTVGPVMYPSLKANNLTMYYQRHGEKIPGTGQTQLLPGAGDAMIPLTGMTYAPMLGMATGKWYRDLAASKGVPLATVLPAGIDTTKPFGLHPLNPWPDALVLDNTEINAVKTAVSMYNNAITAQINRISVDNKVKIGLADMNALFADVAVNGVTIAGEKLTTAFISGGLFSLDGVHPSNKGAGILANEFIKAMNATFGANIPMVDISRIPGLPVPKSGALSRPDLSWRVPAGTFDDVLKMFQH
jgi:lysophospholipase L1-like esterase